MGFPHPYFQLEQKPLLDSDCVAIVQKMEGANGKTGTQTYHRKMSRKATRISSAAICLSIASMTMTILCCSALFLLWSKYDAAIFELENKVKKCQQPLQVVDKLSRNGNSSTKRMISPIFIIIPCVFTRPQHSYIFLFLSLKPHSRYMGFILYHILDRIRY